MSARPTTGDNTDQASYWSSAPGQKWVRCQTEIDELFVPITRRLVERVAPAVGERVLDVGCGAGATTMAFAEAVGPTGAVTGADISAPLLEHATGRKVPGRHDHNNIAMLVGTAGILFRICMMVVA